jgi:predicted O-methyltransferase YrrM
METLKINYYRNSSELCEIGKKYDTDKSSQRSNVTDERHCYPYTLFYESLFRNKRNAPLTIAELGILDGSSLLMWKEYFPHASLYGFECNHEFIHQFKQQYDNDRITLSKIDITNADSIIHTFRTLDTMYDIIIEDITHEFEDQIRIIEHVHSYLKPGGMLIVEDIFKSYDEQNYIKRLQPILSEFQDYYFVELDHFNKKLLGLDNNKLFVLIKGGAEPIFKNNNKLTLITPSYRIDNLMQIKNSINFNYVDEWLIVYDGRKITENPKLFQEHHNIKEFVYKGDGISGNPQRNYALTQISNPTTSLYYLDDDNIIHPNLYRLLSIMDNTKLYTFNQDDRLKGHGVGIGGIDTAMVIIPYQLCNNINWIPDNYCADGHYIKDCYDKNINIHIFVDNILCHYNKIGNVNGNGDINR